MFGILYVVWIEKQKITRKFKIKLLFVKKKKKKSFIKLENFPFFFLFNLRLGYKIKYKIYK